MATKLLLLGSTWIKTEAKTKKLRLTGPSSLLIYLACRNKAVSRSELAFLYRPDKLEDIAQNYLRLQLHRAKRLDWAKNLVIDEQHLELIIETDIKQFQTALTEKNWQKTIDLYRGDFLEGLSLKSSTTYNTWLELERNQYKQDYKLALNKQLELYKNQKDYHNASQIAKKLLGLDEFDESSLQQYLSNLFLSGQNKLAVEYYNEFVKLKKELGSSPLAATQDLISQIKAGKLSTNQSSPTFKTKTFIPQHTQFIGRKKELAKISKLLANPDCRLLTIDGIGGTGKTRLALELAEQQQNIFAAHVYFVALADLNSKEQILTNIAQNLGLKLNPSHEAIKQIIEHINNQEILIVLDNFEHLLEFTNIINDLILSTNNLKIVVTSRARLNLQAEWLYSLRGLNYPTKITSSSINSEAVQLFINAIKRVLPSFTNKQAEQGLATILEICKRVDGLPLALEIAGSWLKKQSLDNILAELDINLNILKTNNPEIPERQQSIQIVLDNSWRYLNIRQQNFLSQFSIFQDAANLAALEKVCSANLGLLLSLYNKSLIRRIPSDNFEMHPLIKQYCSIKLSEQAGLQEDLLNRFSKYYIDFLGSDLDPKNIPTENQLNLQLESINNIRYAWQILLQKQDLDRLEPVLTNIEYLHTTAGQYNDVNQLWDKTLKNLRSLKTSQQRDRFMASILNAKADTSISIGKLAKADKHLKECFSLLEPINAPKQVATALTSSARITWIQGKHEKAQELLEEALVIIKPLKNLKQETTIIHGLAIVLREQNKIAEAKEYYKQVTTVYLSLKEYGNAALALNNLASLNLSQGNIKIAQTDIKKALKLIDGLGAKRSEAFLNLTYAGTLYESKQFEESLLAFQKCLELSQELDDPIIICLALNMIANNYLKLKNYKQTSEYLQKALSLAWKIELIPRVLTIFISFVNLFFEQEKFEDCLQPLAHVIHQTAGKKESEQEATELKDRLEHKLNLSLDKKLLQLSSKDIKNTVAYLLAI